VRTFKVSDELYEQLKTFVVDPFDDTPEAVIGRLVEIVNKAKSRWTPFEEDVPPVEAAPEPVFKRQHQQKVSAQADEVVLL